MANEWPIARLGDLTSKIGSGATPRGGADVYQEQGVALIRSQNVYDDRFATSGLVFVDDDTAEQLSNVAVAAGDVLINITGDSVARAVRAPEEILPARVNQHVAILRPVAGRLDPRFLHAVLVAPRTKQRLLGLASVGATRKALTKGMLRDFEMPVPPIEEQRAIASVLGALEDKIASNRRLRDGQHELRACSFARRFKDRAARVPLEAIAEHVKGTIQPSTRPEEVFEQFSIPAFDASGDPDICLGETMASGKTPLPDDDVVLVSKLNPATLRVWIPVRSGAARAVCSPEFIVLRPRRLVSQAWLDACVRHDDRFYTDMLARVSGTTGSRQRVRPTDLMAATVPDASDAEMKEWTAFAQPMLELEAAMDRERRHLMAIRNLLLPKLVSGQMRVPIVEAERLVA
jgi:type I restriction enzyme, S subunit